MVLQNMTIGQLLFSIQIIAYLFNPLSEISQLHAQIISQKPSFDRVADFLAMPDQQKNTETVAPPKIEAHNIDLMRSESEALFHVNDFTVHGKGLVLIHGENGCGKSSLFNIISGVFAPDAKHRVCDMQFTVVANKSNCELRWQGASYSGAHPVFVFMETHAVPYATSGSFLRTPSAVVSYKTCPANLARTS